MSNLKPCPVCGGDMIEYHTKYWTGQSFKIIRYKWRCVQNQPGNRHTFIVEGVTEAEAVGQWPAAPLNATRKES